MTNLSSLSRAVQKDFAAKTLQISVFAKYLIDKRLFGLVTWISDIKPIHVILFLTDHWSCVFGLQFNISAEVCWRATKSLIFYLMAYLPFWRFKRLIWIHSTGIPRNVYFGQSLWQLKSHTLWSVKHPKHLNLMRYWHKIVHIVQVIKQKKLCIFSIVTSQYGLSSFRQQFNTNVSWEQVIRRFHVRFHLWCELTSTMHVTEWQWKTWWSFQGSISFETNY